MLYESILASFSHWTNFKYFEVYFCIIVVLSVLGNDSPKLACDNHTIKKKQQQKLDTMLDDDDDYDEDEDDGCNNHNDDNNNDATTIMMDFFDHEPTIREKIEVCMELGVCSLHRWRCHCTTWLLFLRRILVDRRFSIRTVEFQPRCKSHMFVTSSIVSFDQCSIPIFCLLTDRSPLFNIDAESNQATIGMAKLIMSWMG